MKFENSTLFLVAAIINFIMNNNYTNCPNFNYFLNCHLFNKKNNKFYLFMTLNKKIL